MVNKILLGIVSAIAAFVLLFAVGDMQDIQDHAKMLVQAWEADGPQTTVVGRLRACLAAPTWLGPLRLSAPRDPMRECGVLKTDHVWCITRGRLACLEDHMDEARADHTVFEAKLLSLVIMMVCVVMFVSFLLVEVPQDVAERFPSLEVNVRNTRLAKKPRSWGYPAGYISPYKRLKDAKKTALSRRRRKQAGNKVSHDSLDWWRGGDDTRGKLVVQPLERLGEKFRPYPYPCPSHPRGRVDPCKALPCQHQHHRQDVQCVCTALSRWKLLLQAANLLLLAYFCFR